MPSSAQYRKTTTNDGWANNKYKGIGTIEKVLYDRNYIDDMLGSKKIEYKTVCSKAETSQEICNKP